MTRTIAVVQSSINKRISVRNQARGSKQRIHTRFTRGGKFHECKFLHTLKGKRVFRTTYGFGTNQIAWYDWYEV